MGTIKDRKGRDLVDAEEIKKRWKEYIEELYKKDLNEFHYYSGVVSHPKPDIMENEVKWALRNTAINKPSRYDGIPVELFKTLKDDAIKMLHSICQKIWKIKQCPQDWKRSILISVPKKVSTKECANLQTITLISSASKVMLKILHAKLQHYVNQELQDAQAGFRKGRGPTNQIANIWWIIAKAGKFQKNYTKAFACVDHNKLWKAFKDMGISDHLTCLLRNLYVVKKQQLEPCMEQLIGSRLRKEYNRAVCRHPVCLTYVLSTSWKMPGWMSYKLESRQVGETSTTSDMWMIPL